jgi:hypothetical protein
MCVPAAFVPVSGEPKAKVEIVSASGSLALFVTAS